VSDQNEIRCSFCSISHREMSAKAAMGLSGIYKMIAGPAGIFICAECVGLCADILVEGRAKAELAPIGDNVELVAKLTTEPDTATTRELAAATARLRALEFALGEIAASATRAMPDLRALRCMWCELALANDDAAREHVATCKKHPAVIELRRKERRPRAARRSER
jgi:hypothetical protein